MDLLRLVVEAFLQEYPAHLTHLKEALTRNDSTAIHRAAHTIRGATATLAIESVTSIAASLERAGATGELEGAERLFDQLSEKLSMAAPSLELFAANQLDPTSF